MIAKIILRIKLLVLILVAVAFMIGYSLVVKATTELHLPDELERD